MMADIFEHKCTHIPCFPDGADGTLEYTIPPLSVKVQGQAPWHKLQSLALRLAKKRLDTLNGVKLLHLSCESGTMEELDVSPQQPFSNLIDTLPPDDYLLMVGC
jgi:hypothetical protein